ncbi:MAG TPA: ABC transporter substrate-binding protein [Candidatus Dormibacteraeota bacterium]|nr:ABC transporter substrate-binding protein [Candidatus Dormibacteraeota bacterium]
MHVGTDHVPPSLGTLVGRLAELGWLDSPDAAMRQLVGDGKTKVNGKMKQLQGEYDGPRIVLIWRDLEPAEAAQQAREFVSERVSVIVAFEDKSIKAAQDATADPQNRIPVVFLHPSDPVRDGLVASLSHPGGNLTGVFGARDPIAKQLELYKEIDPKVRRLLALVDPTDPTTKPLLSTAQTAADQLGIQLDVRDASTDADLDGVFLGLTPGQVDGAFIVSPSLRLGFSSYIIALATRAGLPVQAHRKEWVQPAACSATSGTIDVSPSPSAVDECTALFSLGVDVGPVGTAGARYVDSILKGTPPSQLPVQEVPRVEFALNVTRAAELGIQVPDNVRALADEVYH